MFLPCQNLGVAAMARLASACGLCLASLALLSGHTCALGQPIESRTVAYLLDSTGTIEVQRGGTPMAVTGTCLPLEVGDSVFAAEESSATVVFPLGAYVLAGPGRFHITAQSVNRTESEGNDNKVRPALGSRGSDNALMQIAAEQLIQPPPKLFAAVKPPLMRDTAGLEVLSPRGAVWTTTPEIITTGNTNQEYAVVVSTLTRGHSWKSASKSCSVTGYQVAWKDAQWPALERGVAYQIEILRDGESLTGEDQTFRVLDAEAAEILQKQIHIIDRSVPNGCANLLLKASLLSRSDWKCFSEARRLAVELRRHDPDNPVYLILLQQCYVGLGLWEGYRSVQELLDSIGNCHD